MPAKQSSLLLSLVLTLSAVAVVHAQGWVFADGGGLDADTAYGKRAFAWMIEHGKQADGAAPGVVILGAVPLEKDERIGAFEKAGALWVKALIVDKANADSEAIAQDISAARVVFIRGGDQGRYVGMWKGTRTDKAIHSVFEKGGVVAGTSAGCAVLGGATYDALKDSLHPLQVLGDARHENLSLTYDFLGLVPGVLFDTHFTERGRLPRLAVMLATAKQDKQIDALGLGVDAGAGLAVGPDGVGEVMGDGVVTMLELTPSTAMKLEKGKPPTVTHARMAVLPPGTTVNTRTREILGGKAWSLALDKPAWKGPAEGTEIELKGGDDLWPTFYGVYGGTRVWSGKKISSTILGVLHLVITDPHVTIGVLADSGSTITLRAGEIAPGADGKPPLSVVLIETSGTTRGGMAGAHPGLEMALLHIVAPGDAITPGAGPARKP